MPAALGGHRVARVRRLISEVGALAAFLAERAPTVPDLAGVILFGSVARGDQTGESDLDLLFLFDAPGNPLVTHSQHVARLLGGLDAHLGRTRHPTGFGAALDGRGLAPEFIQNVERDGVVLWARPQFLFRRPRSGVRKVLLHYRTNHLSPAERGRVQRYLFGHTSTKLVGRRRYVSTQPGSVNPAEHPAPATLLLDPAKARTVARRLQELGARLVMPR